MDRPAIAVLSSHVACGSVGNRAIVPALEFMGFNVWAIPTVTLPFHPGHGQGTRLTCPSDDLETLLRDLEKSPFFGALTGILTGYLGHADQAHVIADFIASAKHHKPNLTYLCDPVIGDANALYVPQAQAHAIAQKLMPLADIATPNRFEWQWLQLQAQCAKPSQLIITSHDVGQKGKTGNLLSTAQGEYLIAHDLLEAAPHGTGDLFSALFLGAVIQKQDPKDALDFATHGVITALETTLAAKSQELLVQQQII